MAPSALSWAGLSAVTVLRDSGQTSCLWELYVDGILSYQSFLRHLKEPLLGHHCHTEMKAKDAFNRKLTVSEKHRYWPA